MKKIFLMLMLLTLILSGCEKARTPQNDYEYGAGIIYQSEVSAEECYLCGGSIENIVPSYWGQDNVALISLNTFEIKPLEINRYDRLDGHLITKTAGAISFGGGGSQYGGFSASMMLEYDRCYAIGTLDFLDDKVLDIDKVSSFLCADCINEVLPQRIEKCFGVGIINLGTKKIRLFEENVIGFSVGDFHIEWYPQAQSTDLSQMHLIIFYCPLRYEDST